MGNYLKSKNDRAIKRKVNYESGGGGEKGEYKLRGCNLQELALPQECWTSEADLVNNSPARTRV